MVSTSGDISYVYTRDGSLNGVPFQNFTTLDDIGSHFDSLLMLNDRLTVKPPPAKSPGDVHYFQHKPLNHDWNEIRLLRILGCAESRPGDYSYAHELRCQMHHVSLDAPRRYIALSYTWGDVNDTPFSVLIDWKSMNVTRNLYGALLRLRAQTQCDYFWIDALCIDQTNKIEKDIQLALMPKIYKSAMSVNVWLGEAKRDAALVYDFIVRMVQAGSKREQAGDNRKVPEMSERMRRKYGFPEPNDPGFSALAHVFGAAWSSRAWIIQEVALAKDVVFMYGPHTFGVLLLCVFSALNLYPLEETFRRDEKRFLVANLERTRCMVDKPAKLLPLLIRHRAAEATYPRDKVYALCGIASDVRSGQTNIVFDSEATTRQTYTDTAKAIVRADKNLNILSAVAATAFSQDLPTWVPDWRHTAASTDATQAFFTSSAMFSWQEKEPDFGSHTDFCSDATLRTKADPIFTGSRMIIRAHVIDTLVDVAMPWTLNMAFPPYPVWEQSASVRTDKSPYPHLPRKKILSRRMVYYHTLAMGTGIDVRDPDAFTKECRRFDYDVWRPLRKELEKVLADRIKRDATPAPEVNDCKVFQATQSSKLDGLVDAYQRDPFFQRIMAARNRSIAVTETGRVVLVPGFAEEGDKIILAEGGRVPYVVREKRQRASLHSGLGYMRPYKLRPLGADYHHIVDKRVLGPAGPDRPRETTLTATTRAQTLMETRRSMRGLTLGSAAGIALPERERRKEWRFVGDAYVHGVMDGEAWQPGKCEDFMLI